MVDLMLTFFSAILGMNMRDHHDIPFALPRILFIFVGFIISVIVFPFIDDKNEENDTTDIYLEFSISLKAWRLLISITPSFKLIKPSLSNVFKCRETTSRAVPNS